MSANAYLGAEAIAQAWDAGAEVIVTGRVADPSLAVGPAMAHFGWSATDWDRLGPATMAGHLLECGSQVIGGYFADPGYKDVPDLANVGFPIAEIAADGSCVIGKAANTGGCVTLATVKEQLLYEVHDPAALPHAGRHGGHPGSAGGRGRAGSRGAFGRARPRASRRRSR